MGPLQQNAHPLHVVDLQKIPSILFEAGFITNLIIQQLRNSTNQKENRKKGCCERSFDKYITENK